MNADAGDSARPPAREADTYVTSDERGDAIWRGFLKWITAFAFFLAMLALLASLMLFQLTAEGTAKQALRRSAAALTEIDPLIDRQYDDLQQRAAAAGPDDTIELRDFPIAVPLRAADVRGASREDIRDAVLSRSADRLYASGTAPLRESAQSKGGVGDFSASGVTDKALGFLRSRNHDILAVLTFVLAVICLALGLALARLCRGFGRVASVGAVVFTASVPVVIAGIGARFYMRIISQGDTEYLEREFLEIGRGLAWVPIRDGAAFVVLGLVLLVVGTASARWADRRGASEERGGQAERGATYVRE